MVACPVIYHGWKFNTAGACMDMPTEPGEHGFRDRMKLQGYPVREAGGMVWTYLEGRPAREAGVSQNTIG